MSRHRIASLGLLLLAGCANLPSSEPRLDAIKTIVVIYAENHSFDNMYGMFPGANGVAQATAIATQQRDHDGSVLPRCCRCCRRSSRAASPIPITRARFPMVRSASTRRR
jgi:phospholipase C